MSYNDIARIVEDSGLRPRLMAAVSTQSSSKNPGHWVETHIWRLAALPGWSDAFASARAGNVENPGAHEGVITDSMILSGVQKVLSEESTDLS